jgi:hypothetical protein
MSCCFVDEQEKHEQECVLAPLIWFGGQHSLVLTRDCYVSSVGLSSWRLRLATGWLNGLQEE